MRYTQEDGSHAEEANVSGTVADSQDTNVENTGQSGDEQPPDRQDMDAAGKKS